MSAVRRCIALGAALSALVAAGGAAAQAPLPKAEYLAANCANCHGTNGKSVGGMASLAGYPKAEFIQAMKDFQSGKREATLMHQISKGYTDAQIEAMAEYFAAQKN